MLVVSHCESCNSFNNGSSTCARPACELNSCEPSPKLVVPKAKELKFCEYCPPHTGNVAKRIPARSRRGFERMRAPDHARIRANSKPNLFVVPAARELPPEFQLSA